MGIGLRVSSLLFVLAYVSTVAAQSEFSEQDVRGFDPPTDAQGGLYLEPATTPDAGDYNVGVWLSYANQLLVLENLDTSEKHTPLEHQLSADYLGSVNLTDWLAFGLAVPTVVYQSGTREPGTAFEQAPRKAALGDVRADLKVELLQPGELGTLSVAGLLRGTFPTNTTRSWIGQGTSTGEARLLAQLDYLAGSLFATAGFRYREELAAFDAKLGPDLPWGAGVAFDLESARPDAETAWSVLAEARGRVGLQPAFADEIGSPILAALSLRMTHMDWSALVGGEMGLNGALAGPRARAVLSIGYAPRMRDADEDGLEDRLDQCPEVPEDLDGFEDSNGCPEYDNDQDGVSDTDDRCPEQLEDEDGFQDDDGCPEPDNDRDGILDGEDGCPDQAGRPSTKPEWHGCPPRDSDGDGVFDDVDRCPKEPEDADGFQDDDGCPDRDNDRDRILDSDDACPDQRGPRRSDPKLHGCPSPDKDGDTFDSSVDACPKQPEDFDSVEDDDGCPEEAAGKPLVTVTTGDEGPVLRPTAPVRFVEANGGVEIDPASLTTVRAIGAVLNQNRRWILLVGVRPAAGGADAEQAALNRSFAIVQKLRELTHRDELAESVSWLAVEAAPGAKQDGVGFVVLSQHKRKKKK